MTGWLLYSIWEVSDTWKQQMRVVNLSSETADEKIKELQELPVTDVMAESLPKEREWDQRS